MNMATQEQVAETETKTEAVEVATPELATGDPPATPEFAGDDDGDDEERVGWYVKLLSDPEQPHVIAHPEGKTHEEIFEGYVTARKKGHKVFFFGKVALDPEDISVFGWSEEIDLPAMEAFDGIQERLETLLEAQEQVQQLQGQLLQEELEAEAAEAMEQVAAAAEAGVAASAPVPAGLPKPAKAKRPGGFRPPGA
jgi:hypothetical protein